MNIDRRCNAKSLSFFSCVEGEGQWTLFPLRRNVTMWEYTCSCPISRVQLHHTSGSSTPGLEYLQPTTHGLARASEKVVTSRVSVEINRRAFGRDSSAVQASALGVGLNQVVLRILILEQAMALYILHLIDKSWKGTRSAFRSPRSGCNCVYGHQHAPQSRFWRSLAWPSCSHSRLQNMLDLIRHPVIHWRHRGQSS
ncbi:hypothetical protein M433DRAFT_369527 [Acidomyces richmondensis BFW]|nr:MAG: hypothetical protein FE78DRAFT_196549 [Acidomyces sp. 'richmondensis']KYG48928.1 hypothetical protein M433DRAFT_369527 [Acidomyces richmondensis BFW]